MNTSDHPKFKEEARHLQETIKELEKHLDEILSNSGGEYMWDLPGAVLLKMNTSAERALKM